METYLSHHQKDAVDKLKGLDGAIIWHKVGTGKTRVALTLYAFRKPQGKCLIVCSPNAVRQWKDEIALDPYHYLTQEDFEFVSPAKAGSITIIERYHSFLIVDELWQMKNVNSQRSKSIQKLASYIPTVGLSGSMITARNIEDLYGQACAVGLGYVVAKNLTDFRSQFCIRVENNFGSYDHYAKKGAVDTIHSRLSSHTDVYFPKETKRIVEQRIAVDPTPTQRRLFATWQKDYYVEHEGLEVEARNALTIIIKLQQISDGFLKNETEFKSFPSNKEKRLFEILSELKDAGEKCVVWCAFQQSANHLATMWEQENNKVGLLTGKNPLAMDDWAGLPYFMADTVFCTLGMGASINDFAQFKYSIFYSTSFSALQVEQAKGRTNRASTIHQELHYYFLETDGGIDRHVNETVALSARTEEQAKRTAKEVLERYAKKNK